MVKIINETAELVKLCKEGDLKAFNTIIDNFQKKIFSFVYRLLGNYDDSADLTQEVFIKFYNNISSFREESSLQTWLFRIASNEVKNFWKSRKSKQNQKTISINENEQNDEGQEMQIADKSISPRDSASENQLISNLESQMRLLNPEFREILILRFKEELSYEEIAEVLGINAGTVKSRIARGREELKKLMEPYL